MVKKIPLNPILILSVGGLLNRSSRFILGDPLPGSLRLWTVYESMDG